MSRLHAVGIVALLALFGCQHQPRYAWIYDRHEDFSKLKTYQWLEPVQKGTAHRDIGGVAIDQLIRQIADQDLAAKGFTIAPAGATPDFTVRQTSILEFRSGETGAGGPVFGSDERLIGEKYEVVSTAPDLEPAEPSSYKVGTIEITMLDPKSNAVLWRGMAEATLYEQATDQQRRERLENSMHKLLDNFPPKPKG